MARAGTGIRRAAAVQKNGGGAEAITERRELILRHGLALWDVLASCDIQGAGDSSIRNAVPNDLGAVLSAAPIRKILCTGKTAFSYFEKYCRPHVAPGTVCACLPSTSPANAAWSLEKLVQAYRAELEDCR